jgi:hypothetical protein
MEIVMKRKRRKMRKRRKLRRRYSWFPRNSRFDLL